MQLLGGGRRWPGGGATPCSGSQWRRRARRRNRKTHTGKPGHRGLEGWKKGRWAGGWLAEEAKTNGAMGACAINKRHPGGNWGQSPGARTLGLLLTIAPLTGGAVIASTDENGNCKLTSC